MNIRPVSDLRNNFTSISKELHETKEPIFLTRKGRGDIVVMSIEAYNKMTHQAYVEKRLLESEIEVAENGIELTHEEVFGDIKRKLEKRIGEQ